MSLARVVVSDLTAATVAQHGRCVEAHLAHAIKVSLASSLARHLSHFSELWPAWPRVLLVKDEASLLSRLGHLLVVPSKLNLFQPKTSAHESNVDASLRCDHDLVPRARLFDDSDVASHMLKLLRQHHLPVSYLNEVNPAVHLTADNVFVVKHLQTEYVLVQLYLVL